MTFALNALDQAAIYSDKTPADALAATVELARALDAIGYKRFWFAEHHNTAAFACSAPEILIAHVAAQTKHLRVGSGGVMLPHYSPLKVAEQFRMLDALTAARIDLGIGRAPGGDAKTAAVLQPGPQAYPVDVFPQQVQLLLQFLQDAAGLQGAAGGFADDHPYLGMHAQPMGNEVPVFMLGSGGDGAVHAAQFGLPYIYAHFINPDGLAHALDIYREHFRPSRYCDKPCVMVAVSVLAAETDEAAQAAALPRNIWAAQMRLSRAGRFYSLQEARDHQPTPDEATLIDEMKTRPLTGAAERVAEELRALATRHAIDEFFLLTLTPDQSARLASYRLIAEQIGITS